MYIPKPYFENIPQIGDLALDYIFIENDYPILFTCCKEEKLYLCLCRTIYEEQKWVISEINSNHLEKCIMNELSIHDTLKNGIGRACIAHWRKESHHETFEVMYSNQLDDSDLPDETVFLDDEGESQEYLEVVKNREQNIQEKITRFFNLNVTSNSAANINFSFDFYENEINTNDTPYLNRTSNCVINDRKESFYINKAKLNYEDDDFPNSVGKYDSVKSIQFAA